MTEVIHDLLVVGTISTVIICSMFIVMAHRHLKRAKTK